MLISTIFYEQLKHQEKGLLSKDCSIDICKDKPAVENFLELNRITEEPFVSFSESELVVFFWKRDQLRIKIRDMAAPDFLETDVGKISLSDVVGWLGTKEPGYIIKHLLSDEPKNV